MVMDPVCTQHEILFLCHYKNEITLEPCILINSDIYQKIVLTIVYLKDMYFSLIKL